jgi:hypothetical protein
MVAKRRATRIRIIGHLVIARAIIGIIIIIKGSLKLRGKLTIRYNKKLSI